MMSFIKDFQSLDETGLHMPVLFIGHGSPMNGIEDNNFTRGWQRAVKDVPKPKAIIVVSAHWETNGTKITAMPEPPVIYDFYGFPKELSEVKYKVAGSPELAAEISQTLREKLIELDESWGLDHGTWTILKHLYPAGDVPVLQISLNRLQSPQEHFKFAKELAFLRSRGILIIGSGNMVHNLRQINFHQAGGAEWANEANEIFKKHILSGEFEKIINYGALGKAVALSVPTQEHFLPLLYTLGLKRGEEPIEIFNDSVDLGSISMTSVKIG